SSGRSTMVGQHLRWVMVALAVLLLSAFAAPGMAQDIGASKEYGIAAKRPVLQASCRYCPWGQLADILTTIMAPAYDLAICYRGPGENGVRCASRRLVAAGVSDRLFAQGTSPRPDAPIDFGITQMEYGRRGYEGIDAYKKDGPLSNLRLIAR